MKTILLTVGIAAATLLPTAPKQSCAALPDYRVAIAGCCKQFDGSRWTSYSRNFEDCVRLNASADNDDIFVQSGKFWWDVRC